MSIDRKKKITEKPVMDLHYLVLSEYFKGTDYDVPKSLKPLIPLTKEIWNRMLEMKTDDDSVEDLLSIYEISDDPKKYNYIGNVLKLYADEKFTTKILDHYITENPDIDYNIVSRYLKHGINPDETIEYILDIDIIKKDQNKLLKTFIDIILTNLKNII